jgi:hypothetical protein
MKRQHLASVLGLSMDGGRLEGVVLRRTNGAVKIEQTFSAELSLDPLTNDAELVGREIRNHLEAAEVRERHCVAVLPLKWALTTHTKLPELPEADLASFLQIEAERAFPSDVATLMLANSRSQASNGQSYATQVGVPRGHIASVEAALRAAQLKPVSFSLGITVLQPAHPDPSNGVLALAIGDTNVGLQVTCGGGVLALRALEGTLVEDGGQRRLLVEAVAREARITLGQLPPEFREAVRRVRIFGPRDLAQQLADEIELRLESMDLKVELVDKYAAVELGVHAPAGAAVSPAFSLAAGLLAGRNPEFEFLPPRVTAWQQLSNRYSSGKLRTILSAAGGVALIVAILFLVQQIELWRLQAKWDKLSPTVTELQGFQDKIRQYSPWFDNSIRGLTIMRRIAESFPEDGTVTAKTLEIRELNTIVCGGVARDRQSLLKTLAQLRKAPGISEVFIGSERTQGQSLQFTFNFKWSEADSHAN